MARRLLFCSLPLCLALPAHAVVVRGRVTTPLGRPLPGARVQLVQGARSVADTISGPDGSYELDSAAAGRFRLLASSSLRAARPALTIDGLFYAGSTDLVTRDVVLDPDVYTPQRSALATRLPLPLLRLADAIGQVPADRLLGAASVLPELARLPGGFAVQQGVSGTTAQLYVRGLAPSGTAVQVDGASAEDLGGGLNLASLGAAGLAAIAPEAALELAAGAHPLWGVDAAAGLLAVHTQPASSLRPSLLYAGDAGNLASVRQEGAGEIMLLRADLRAAYERFDTDSGSPALGAHLGSAAAQANYFLSSGTSLHATLRQDVLAAPLAVPELLFSAPPAGRAAEQNLYGTGSFETTTAGGWRTSVSYGLTRRRGQTLVFSTPVQTQAVTVRGANGFTATGIAVLPALASREDAVTLRDELRAETSYPARPWLTALGSFRFRDERALDLLPGLRRTLGRQHAEFTGGFSGSLARHRLAYEAQGLVDDAKPFGVVGAPRLGLTWAPVLEGTRRLRGTTLHATAAEDFREPSLAEQSAVVAPVLPRTRTVSAGVDQTILPGRLDLHATYFHAQAAHAFEPSTRQGFVQRYTQTLAYRAQGIESTLRYQPFQRLLLTGSYTWLAALVEQSVQQPAANPALAGIAIGAASALAGARPFHRPPHSGSFVASFTGRRLAVNLAGAFASRSDSSTGEGPFAPQGSALLLPNRNLSPAYLALDAAASYVLSGRVTLYTQLGNLLDSAAWVPTGYRATPFSVRTGLRLRLGGE